MRLNEILQATPVGGAAIGWSFATATCPCSLWPSTATPAITSVPSGLIEVGVTFVPQVSGYVTALRFYKGPGNTGTHVGTLWNAPGGPITLTFTNESTTGWQQVVLSPTARVTAGSTYVASYTASNGGYAFDRSYFPAAGVARGPVHTPTAAGVFGLPGSRRPRATRAATTGSTSFSTPSRAVHKLGRVTSGGQPLVLVDPTAEPIVAKDVTTCRRGLATPPL